MLGGCTGGIGILSTTMNSIISSKQSQGRSGEPNYLAQICILADYWKPVHYTVDNIEVTGPVCMLECPRFKWITPNFAVLR